MPPRERTDKNTPLYRWRMAAGLTMREAAVRMLVSFTTYRRLEAMKTLPKRHAAIFAMITARKK
jgi:transcriptional regulator with XRE-family HTH domain